MEGRIVTGGMFNSGTPDGFKPFRWNGKYGKGAMRTYRNQKRLDAMARQEAWLERGCSPADERYLRAAGVRVDRRTPERIMREAKPWDGEAPNQDQMGLKKCTCVASIRPRAICICE